MREHHNERNFTSSEPTDVSQQSEAVLALGRKLVEELGIESSVDTLGRWMAHYVAELMGQASTAPPGERPTAQGRCFDAIIELWQHRAALPLGQQPLAQMEPVVRALASLDPDSGHHRYARPFWAEKQDRASDSEADRWLDAADDADRAARLLIGYTLSRAAEAAADSCAAWVTLAAEAGLDARPFEILVELMGLKGKRSGLRDHLKRLGSLSEMVALVAADLNERLREPD